MSEYKNQKVVTMDNNLIRASYRLTLNELRLLLVAMSQMPKDDTVELDPATAYYVTKDDFVRMGVDPKNAARDIRKACSDLLHRNITINLGYGLELHTHWIDNVLTFKSEMFKELKEQYPNSKNDDEFIWTLRKYNLLTSLPFILKSDENLMARIVFHRDIVPFISQLKKQFTKLNLDDVSQFKSFYSYRIYLMLMQFHKTGFVRISLDEFRQMLELTNKYPDIKDLRKWVIDVAFQDINKTSPIFAEYTLTKTGRKFTHLEIKFKQKETIEIGSKDRDPNTPDIFTGKTDNELRKTQSWQLTGLSDNQIKKLAIFKQEFIDANSDKIPPSYIGSYDDLFNEWKNKLKDPSQVMSFNKIQELLDRKK